MSSSARIVDETIGMGKDVTDGRRFVETESAGAITATQATTIDNLSWCKRSFFSRFFTLRRLFVRRTLLNYHQKSHFDGKKRMMKKNDEEEGKEEEGNISGKVSLVIYASKMRHQVVTRPFLALFGDRAIVITISYIVYNI